MTAQATTVQTTTVQTTTAQHRPTMAIQPKPVRNRRNIRPTKVSCPAGCGKEFVGKGPKLGGPTTFKDLC